MVSTIQATGAEEVVWDLTPLFSGVDDPQIQVQMTQSHALADEFVSRYKGKLGQMNAQDFADAMKAMEQIRDLAGRISSFAMLLYSTDTANPAHGALLQKIQEFNAQLEQKLVFFNLEWNQLPDEQANTILSNPILGGYAHHLEAARRYKPHQMTEAEERIAIEKNVTGRQAWTRFFTQMTSAMRYDYDGELLNQTQILTKMHSPDRAVRQKAADVFTEGLKSRAMEFTYIFNVLATDKAIDDRLHRYENWLDSRNLSNKTTQPVVDALVQSVTSNYELVMRHYRLKRRILGYDELYEYDRYAPLPIKQSEQTYRWDEAREIVLNAFYAFDNVLGDSAKRFFDEKWIHAAVLPNKRGGAYASPVVPSVHPYVFLNYDGQARDVSTLAHELGHGVHMLLSGQKSGLFGLYTPLTTAETASTFAEMLVFNDLLRRETDPQARLAMLASRIEDSFSTIFRQVAMNRFEDGFHTLRRTQGELTTEQFSDIWMQTQGAMFGDSVTLREQYRMWWAYVPHFLHTPGYVYAYAFGELLVLSLYDIYQKEGASFAPKYIDALAAGNSDYPDRIMAGLGVDLNDPNFWNGGLNVLATLVQQEEELAEQLYG
ncbi:MAG: M3 family oligoendopeptidase [Phototrophicales bacterium]